MIVRERAQVAAFLAAEAGELCVGALVDDHLRAVAIGERLLRPWRSLVGSELEQLVDDLGGEPGDVEQLRREGAAGRADA